MPTNFLIQFLVSGAAGFIFWKFFAGKHEGDRPKRSLRLEIGEYLLHIHHWILCSLALGCVLFLETYNPIVLGLLVGSILQGLSYKDRFVVLYKHADFKKIYAEFKK